MALGLLAALALPAACADDPPPSVWDDLTGTIYFLGGTYNDSIRRVDPRTGVIGTVPDPPMAFYLAAAPSGDWLLVTMGGVLRYDLRSFETSVVAPNTIEYNAHHGSVSPDGQRVAYARTDTSGYALLVRDVSGANPRVIVGPTHVGTQHQPAWIDTARLVFIHNSAGVARLRTVHADGTGLGYFASDTGLHIGAVAVSPQTQRLVVERRPTGAPPSELWEMDYAGAMRRLVAVDGLYPWFAWSPDGKYLVYCAATATSTADLFLLEVASAEVRQLTSEPGSECHPAWTPE